MASLEGNKQFFNELDKVQKRLNDAVRSQNQIGREKFALDMTLAQQGLFSQTDPNTGEQSIQKLSPEQNTVLQARIQNIETVATAQQEINNKLARSQLVSDLDLQTSQQAQDLKTFQNKQARQAALFKTQTQAEIVKSPSGQILQEQGITQAGRLSKARAKGEAIGKAEAALDPKFKEIDRAEDLMKIANQQITLNVIKNMDPNLNVTSIEQALAAGKTVDERTLAMLTQKAINTNSTEARKQQQVDRLLGDLKKLATSAGLDPDTIALDENSSPDVIESVIKSLLTAKPKGVTLPEFNKFSQNVVETSSAFDKVRTLQLYLRDIKQAGGIVFNAVDIPPRVRTMFPKLLKDLNSIDSDDDPVEILEGELGNLQSEYTILAQSLIERGKRNPEFQKKVDELTASGIILKTKKSVVRK